MSGKCFLDTNILIYSLSVDENEKHQICRGLIKTKKCIISTQVLNEISNTLLKKFKISNESVLEVITDLNSSIDVVNISFSTIVRALKLSKKYKYSYYDSLMLSSAIENNCDLIYSEDMNHEQIVEKKLKILNPFKVV